MSNISNLPALGLLAAASAAFGLHLGESAISEIDPVHFRGPAIHPSARGAAVDPADIADEPERPRFASLYGWDEGNAARAENCWDCDALAARDAHAYAYGHAAAGYAEAVEKAEAYLDRAEAEWTGRDPHWSDEEEWTEEEGARESDWEEVERYAHYPVTAREAERFAEAESGEAEEPEQPDGLKIVYTDAAGGL